MINWGKSIEYLWSQAYEWWFPDIFNYVCCNNRKDSLIYWIWANLQSTILLEIIERMIYYIYFTKQNKVSNIIEPFPNFLMISFRISVNFPEFCSSLFSAQASFVSWLHQSITLVWKFSFNSALQGGFRWTLQVLGGTSSVYFLINSENIILN